MTTHDELRTLRDAAPAEIEETEINGCSFTSVACTLFYDAAHAALPALLDRIAALETERDALGAWECATCGARFSTPAPPELLKGVTQCTRCVEYRLLGGRVAGLEATVHNKEAALEAYRIEREQIRAALNDYADSDLASLAETLTRRNDALEAENERLSNIEKCTRAYLAVKKSWDNTLRELRTLRAALEASDVE